jgi:transposase InsO family protein
MMIIDVCTRLCTGFSVARGDIGGTAVRRLFNRAISRQPLPKHLPTYNDPLFRFHRWRANLRILYVEEIKTIPFDPCSHPFVEG